MSRRILLYDPDSSHATHCEEFLSAEGFELVHAASLLEARRHVGDEALAAAIIDGPADAQGIRELLTSLSEDSVPLFGITDVYLGDTNRAVALMYDRYHDFWVKPIPSAELLRWLQRALGDEYATPAPSEPQTAPVMISQPPVAETPSTEQPAAAGAHEDSLVGRARRPGARSRRGGHRGERAGPGAQAQPRGAR